MPVEIKILVRNKTCLPPRNTWNFRKANWENFKQQLQRNITINKNLETKANQSRIDTLTGIIQQATEDPVTRQDKRKKLKKEIEREQETNKI